MRTTSACQPGGSREPTARCGTGTGGSLDLGGAGRQLRGSGAGLIATRRRRPHCKSSEKLGVIKTGHRLTVWTDRLTAAARPVYTVGVAMVGLVDIGRLK